MNHDQYQITAKQVTRYAVLGKTHATKLGAYRALAKCEIDREAEWKAPNIFILSKTSYKDRGLAVMFPRRCRKPNVGRQNFKQIRHGENRDYCRGCYFEAVEARARELMEAGEARAAREATVVAGEETR